MIKLLNNVAHTLFPVFILVNKTKQKLQTWL